MQKNGAVSVIILYFNNFIESSISDALLSSQHLLLVEVELILPTLLTPTTMHLILQDYYRPDM